MASKDYTFTIDIKAAMGTALEELRKELQELEEKGELTLNVEAAQALKNLQQFSKTYQDVIDKLSNLKVKSITEQLGQVKDIRNVRTAVTQLYKDLDKAVDADVISAKDFQSIKSIIDNVSKNVQQALADATHSLREFQVMRKDLATSSDIAKSNIETGWLNTNGRAYNALRQLTDLLAALRNADPNLEWVKASDVTRAEQLMDVLKVIDGMSDIGAFDATSFAKIEDVLSDVGIDAEKLKATLLETFNTTPSELTEAMNKLSETVSEAREKLKSGFSDVSEIQKYKNEITDLRKVIKGLDEHADFSVIEGFDKGEKSLSSFLGQLSKAEKAFDTTAEAAQKAEKAMEQATGSTKSSTGQTPIQEYRSLTNQIIKAEKRIAQIRANNLTASDSSRVSNDLEIVQLEETIAVNEKYLASLNIIQKKKNKYDQIRQESAKRNQEIYDNAVKAYEAEQQAADEYVKIMNQATKLEDRKTSLQFLDLQGDSDAASEIAKIDNELRTLYDTANNIKVLDSVSTKWNAEVASLQSGQVKLKTIVAEIKKEYQTLTDLEVKQIKNTDPTVDYSDDISNHKAYIASLEQMANQTDVTGVEMIEATKKIESAQQSMEKAITRATESVKKQTESAIKKSDLRTNTILGMFDEESINALSSTGNSANKVNGYKEYVEKVQAAYKELVEYIESHDLSDAVNWKEAKTQADTLADSLKVISNGTFKKVNTKGQFLGNLSDDIAEARSEAEQLIKTISNVDQSSLKWSRNGTTLSYLSKDDSGVYQQAYASIVKYADGITQLRTVSTGTESSMSKFQRTMSNLAKASSSNIASTVAMYSGLQDFIQYVRQGIEVFKEYDLALTDISYTTEGTAEQISEMGRSYVQLAKDLSSSVADSMEVASIYANLQTSTEEVMQSVEPTLMLANATGVDASDASDQIQGVLQQFDLAADQSEHVVDVFESISSNLQLDFGKAIDAVAEGVSVAGQTASDAGMTFEELAAIIGKVAETTRDSGSEVGNSLKTILTRISKASTMSDEVDNETISDAAAALHEVGVEVYESDGTFRNFTTILKELQSVWSSLSDAQQAFFISSIFA